MSEQTEYCYVLGVATQLNTEVNEILKKVENNEIIAFAIKGTLSFPVEQFQGSSVVPGISKLVKLWNFQNNGVGSWRNLSTPLEPLNGDSILDLLKKGDFAEAEKIAKLFSGGLKV